MKRKIKEAVRWFAVLLLVGAAIAAVATKSWLWAGACFVGFAILIALGEGDVPSGPPQQYY